MTDFTKTIEHIKIIEKHGGPKIGSCYDLATGMVEAKDDQGECAWYFCPQACHAAIIAWTGEMRAWWIKKPKLGVRGSVATVTPSFDEWRFELRSKLKIVAGGYRPTQLAACLALIEAVAERLGEG